VAYKPKSVEEQKRESAEIERLAQEYKKSAAYKKALIAKKTKGKLLTLAERRSLKPTPEPPKPKEVELSPKQAYDYGLISKRDYEHAAKTEGTYYTATASDVEAAIRAKGKLAQEYPEKKVSPGQTPHGAYWGTKEGQAKRREEFIRKKAAEPETALAYTLSPGEFFGAGALYEAAQYTLAGESWEARRKEILEGFTTSVFLESEKKLKEGKTPKEIGEYYGSAGGLWAGGKAGLMAASGGAFGATAGVLGSTTMKGLYGWGVGTQAARFITAPPEKKHLEAAGLFVWSTPLIFGAAAKAWPKIRGKAGPMKGTAKPTKPPKPKLALKKKKALISKQYFESMRKAGIIDSSGKVIGKPKTKIHISQEDFDAMRRAGIIDKTGKILKMPKKTHGEIPKDPVYVASYTRTTTTTTQAQGQRRQSQAQRQRQRQDEFSLSGLGMKQAQKQRQREFTLSGMGLSMKQISAQKRLPKQAQGLGLGLKQMQLPKTSFDFGFKQAGLGKMGRIFARPKAGRPYIPPPLPPLLPAWGRPKRRKKAKKGRKYKRKYRYTATLGGALFLKPIPKAPKGILTGLRMRPIIRKKSKTRKKGKQRKKKR